jgi:hypothetical protein
MIKLTTHGAYGIGPHRTILCAASVLSSDDLDCGQAKAATGRVSLL